MRSACCAEGSAIFDYVGPEDVIAFTGSSDFDAVLKTVHRNGGTPLGRMGFQAQENS